MLGSLHNLVGRIQTITLCKLEFDSHLGSWQLLAQTFDALVSNFAQQQLHQHATGCANGHKL